MSYIFFVVIIGFTAALSIPYITDYMVPLIPVSVSILIWALVNGLDVHSTFINTKRAGSSKNEFNPLGKWAIDKFGVIAGPVYVKVIPATLAAFVAVIGKEYHSMLIFMNIFMFIVVLNNYLIYVSAPRNLSDGQSESKVESDP